MAAANTTVPMIRPGESDAEYDSRLKAMGITDEVFQAWFESHYPLSDGHISFSEFHDEETA